ETSLQYSAGCQYALEEKTFIDLSLYYYDISDLIIYRNNGYINREEAEHYGAEMRLNSTYFDQNRLRISYAYAYTQDSEGEALAYIPRHQLKIEDTVSLTPKLDAYLGYQYTGNRSSPNSATYSDEQMDLKAYHLLDTQFSYMLTPSINGRAGIKNILDESYEWRYGYPARGRSYYLSLTWKL
ncbi:MAG TPA: TonB-dependent receptor, partial [Epsilonproteobacteria bacterium]|nr:TonB-dependent receptor [Campylobacterota bacterium]